MSKVEYTSNAMWTKIALSRDIHDSKEMAFGVARKLLSDYQDRECSITGRCLESWVDKVIDGKVVSREVTFSKGATQ